MGETAVAALLAVMAGLAWPRDTAAEDISGEKASLSWMVTHGRPAGLYELTRNQSESCESLLTAFNAAFPRLKELPGSYAPFFSGLLLKSRVSIKWGTVEGHSPSLLFGVADIDNDGTVEWLAEEVSREPVTPLEISGPDQGLPSFVASEIAIVEGKTPFLTTSIPMRDKSLKYLTIIAYSMHDLRHGDVACELRTHQPIVDIAF